MPFPRWVTGLLAAVAVGLVPWTLWLTFSLPAKQVNHHYELAWVGFDVALAAMFAVTASAAYRRSRALMPLAAAVAAMLVSDAWFDIVTATPGERVEAILEACLAELPLAVICALVAFGRLRRA